MTANLIQPSFSGGELSPSLYARVDLARYGTSLKTCKNFIVRPYGGVDNRPGLRFIGEVKNSAKATRLLPFEYSSEIAYVIEMSDLRMRFIYQGAYVLATTSTAWSNAVTYAVDDLVTDGGIIYRSLQGTNLNHTPASSPTWWQPNPVTEVVTPWTEAEIWDVKFTQSADVMYLVHPGHKPKELRRTSANAFSMVDYQANYGPFRNINIDESIKVASSAATGATTLTSNSAIFSSALVGSLVYLEQKDLTGTRPWEPGDRGVTVGAQRRSDGKTYRCSAIPGGSPTWKQTGANKPIHEVGKAWDGPGDTRTSGTDTYTVGVEWEYLHPGFGIVLITGYTNSSTVTGIVVKRVPDPCIGSLTVSTTWNLTGDGVTKTFAIAGAVSPSERDYSVTISGVPVQSNPYGQGGSSDRGECVVVEAVLPDGMPAGEIQPGDTMLLHDPQKDEPAIGTVTYSEHKRAPCVRIVTASYASLSCSVTAPIPVKAGGCVLAPELFRHQVLVLHQDGSTAWEPVIDIVRLGERDVQHITVGDRCFWAGDDADKGFLLHHNTKDTR